MGRKWTIHLRELRILALLQPGSAELASINLWRLSNSLEIIQMSNLEIELF